MWAFPLCSAPTPLRHVRPPTSSSTASPATQNLKSHRHRGALQSDHFAHHSMDRPGWKRGGFGERHRLLGRGTGRESMTAATSPPDGTRMATADMPTIVTRRLTKDYGGCRAY